MKSRKKYQPLRQCVDNRNNHNVQQSTVYAPKPLLKASTNLPIAPSPDETNGFIKGYN